MLKFSNYFADYGEFKTQFYNEHGRHNGLVLDYVKWCFKHRDDSTLHKFVSKPFEVRFNMNMVYDHVVHMAAKVSSDKYYEGGNGLYFRVDILGLPTFYSSTIESDSLHGVCMKSENALSQVRFQRHLTDEQRDRNGGCDRIKPVSLKAGKFLRELLLESIPNLSESVLNYCCETFAAKWRSDRVANTPRYELHIDTNFKAIYGNDPSVPYKIDGSCMSRGRQHKFYEDSVKAHAAYITDKDQNNAIVARCIIFDEVYIYGDESGKAYRYAERQYAQGSKMELKQLLIDMLIREGLIDFYKEVGASYDDRTRIYRVSDRAFMEDYMFYIVNTIEEGDVLSYQDTFVNLYDGYAYNKFDDDVEYGEELCTCDAVFGGGEYDDYHECYCRETTRVYAWDEIDEFYRSYDCDVNRLEDFTIDDDDDEYYDQGHEIRGYFYHYGSRKVVQDYNGDYILKDDAVLLHDGDWAHENEAVFSERENAWILFDEAIEIGNKWYVEEKCQIVENNDFKKLDEDRIILAY